MRSSHCLYVVVVVFFCSCKLLPLRLTLPFPQSTKNVDRSNLDSMIQQIAQLQQLLGFRVWVRNASERGLVNEGTSLGSLHSLDILMEWFLALEILNESLVSPGSYEILPNLFALSRYASDELMSKYDVWGMISEDYDDDTDVSNDMVLILMDHGGDYYFFNNDQSHPRYGAIWYHPHGYEPEYISMSLEGLVKAYINLYKEGFVYNEKGVWQVNGKALRHMLDE